jgi:hypothetical protein
MPPKKRPQAFTYDSPSPVAAAAKKPRISPAKTLWNNKALKEAERTQETHVLVNVVRALEYIGCEDAVPIYYGVYTLSNPTKYLEILGEH